MSTSNQAPVFRIESVAPHAGADSLEIIKFHESGRSLMSAAAPFREGIVVKPVVGRGANYGRHFGRLILKSVSPEYLAK